MKYLKMSIMNAITLYQRGLKMNSRLSAGCALLLMLAFLLTGCASGKRSYSSGEQAIQDRNYDLAVAEFSEAVQADPSNAEFRARLATARGRAAWFHLENGRELKTEKKYVEASSEFRLAIALNPVLDVAALEYRKVQSLIEARELAAEAQDHLHARRLVKAEKLALQALEIDPDNEAAQKLIDQLTQESKVRLGGFDLDVDSKKPVTLKFKDAKLQEVFKILNRLSGINFIFDEDLKNEQVTLLLEDATFAQALELLMKMNNLGSRVLNPKTVIIYSNTKDKQKQYEDQIIQTFYLSSIDAKKAVNMLRTMLQLRKIYVHEELNAIVVRDRPDVIELVSQMLTNADLADSEVVFDLELIEVSHGDLLKFGPELSPYGISVAGVKNGDIIDNTLPSTGVGNLITELDGIDAFFTLPTATFDFSKQLTDTEILATPKIRVKNREKAKVHVGTREPSITSTISGENVSENVQYIDVGVKVDVEPVIQLDGTVRAKIRLEVSSASDPIETSNSRVFTINTTNAETSLILKDGERTILGGLIRTVDQETKDTIPILGDIPLIGSLFTHYDITEGKREILLSVTPHIVKKVDIPGRNASRIWSGGEEELKAGPNFAAFAEKPDPDDTPVNAPPKVMPPPAEKPAPVTELEPVEATVVAPRELEQPTIPTEEPAASAQVPPVTPVAIVPEPLQPEIGQPLTPETGVQEQVAQIEVPPAEIRTPVQTAKLFVSGAQLVDVGDEFSVELQVSEINSLYSAPLFVNYDPILLDFVRADEGGFLRAPGQSTVFTSSPNRSRGELIIGNKQGAGGEGASGSGTLTRIIFKAKKAGNAVIRPNRVNFRDPSGSRMPINVDQFKVEIR
jgi:general secretion pathway protein D